ncbi:MAG TPA: LrgB family protein [Candidatus Izemoplasmatales bacterium]|nr:LrgB family protein [Bacillota bacterium]HRY78558.1 LrgB family protein [Candidatus Izemoplasmatales bacterium]
MREILSSQEMGITLALFFYVIGEIVYRKTRIPLLSPLIVATILLMAYVWVIGIDLSVFLTDLSGIHVFLGPLIVSLAIPIVKRIQMIKEHLLPILVGSVVGAATSILTVILLGNILGLDETILASILPKASTTPIAIEVSERLGGIRAITVATVVITAVAGAVVIPLLIKIFKIKDPIVIGLGLGATSQAIGTAKALEIDETAGAVSSVALVFTGVATAILAIFI